MTEHADSAIPREARQYQGQVAGLVTRALSGLVDTGVVGALSLGVLLAEGTLTEGGHSNHLRVINEVRRHGSIAAASAPFWQASLIWTCRALHSRPPILQTRHRHWNGRPIA